MTEWRIERIAHFDFNKGDSVIDGLVHFGFHDRAGNQYLLEHQKHFLGLLGSDGELEWTVAARQVFKGTLNIAADLRFPIYLDSLPDGTLVVSNFGDSHLYRIEQDKMRATLFVDGARLGMKHAGNCVVDDEGYVWLNEVEGCKVWKFDSTGKPLLKLGTGEPGFQSETSDFNHVRFNWIYDIRKGPDGNIYVLDSKNYAVRMIDTHANRVETIAGTGKAGYEGDGGDPRHATFGSTPSARFDGPISMSLDEQGNIYVGDRFNHVVRMIEKETNTIRTLAGDAANTSELPNDPNEPRLLYLRLPKISSMDYYEGRLFIPTDLQEGTGDLIVLKKRQLD